ncbi:MAG: CPBP family intramembrane metalloprotease [Gemmatimonadetes bacterium]|nr:CPBP family intramembrane metalloprotease [Gemmatimonadota bacterium]
MLLISTISDWLQVVFLSPMHWFARLSQDHPGLGEVGVIISSITPPALTMTLLLGIGQLGNRYVVAPAQRSQENRELVKLGVRYGLPYGVCGYFVYWWIGLPSNLSYTGVTGTYSSFGVPILTMLLIYAAVCEELFFRGFLFRAAKEVMPTAPAAAIGIAAFVVWHPSLYHDAARLMALVVGAVLYTYLTHRSGSAVPAACAHGCFNATQILLTNM